MDLLLSLILQKAFEEINKQLLAKKEELQKFPLSLSEVLALRSLNLNIGNLASEIIYSKEWQDVSNAHEIPQSGWQRHGFCTDILRGLFDEISGHEIAKNINNYHSAAINLLLV